MLNQQNEARTGSGGGSVRRHPPGTYAFVWTCNLAALLFAVGALLRAPLLSYEPRVWIDFGVWTLIVCVARLGVIQLAGSNVNAGWFTAIEFGAALILPFPLFCAAILLSFVLIVLKRIRKRHPEPYLGPDFNAANSILSARAAGATYHWVLGVLPGEVTGAATAAVLPSAIAFVTVHTLLLTTILAIDERKKWWQVSSLGADALVSDGMMITAGCLLGRLYQEDPSLLGFTLLPLLFLQKTLGRLNEAKLAYIDGKTGLYNYRYLDEALADLFKKASHGRKPLSLVFGDMDHLRDINNTYGHLAGDKALAAVARAFLDAGVPDAVAARFGGEEFVLVLPGYEKGQAAEVAELIRQAAASTAVPIEGGQVIRVTISMGVAAYPEDAGTLEQLVKAADEAVYEAKHMGRNRVCLYTGRKAALH
jgi:diguanylate cyclase